MKRVRLSDRNNMENNSRPIIYATPPAPVSMGDPWFELATSNHFWIRRRFHVMDRMAGDVIRAGREVAEIGCGNGLVQQSIESHYGITVSGFDLNEFALKKSVCSQSQRYCYDIHQRSEDFRARFDVILLFDVLEHIPDENAFLQSIRFHLRDSGILLVNVPAFQSFYSNYDKVVGHFRRYNAGQLNAVLEKNGFAVRRATYWGAPLIPALVARKALLAVRHGSEKAVVSLGFDTGSRVVNSAMGLLARLEPIPQRLTGTSYMAVAEKT
jgi:SAM-dependent methyltransferase